MIPEVPNVTTGVVTHGEPTGDVSGEPGCAGVIAGVLNLTYYYFPLF